MTNYEAIMKFSEEEMAVFLAHEAYRMVKPVFDLCGYGVCESFIYALRLKWLKSEVNENEG